MLRNLENFSNKTTFYLIIMWRGGGGAITTVSIEVNSSGSGRIVISKYFQTFLPRRRLKTQVNSERKKERQRRERVSGFINSKRTPTAVQLCVDIEIKMKFIVMFMTIAEKYLHFQWVIFQSGGGEIVLQKYLLRNLIFVVHSRR